MNNTKQKSALLRERIFCFGGDGRDRTDDLHTASVALSQLSYAPVKFVRLLYHKCEAEQVAERYDTMFSAILESFAFLEVRGVIIAYPFLLCKHFLCSFLNIFYFVYASYAFYALRGCCIRRRETGYRK